VRRCRERPRREPVAAPLTLAGLAALAAAGGAGAYLGAPPPAHTGGFGEPTCAACHRDAPLDEPGGFLTLGAPPRYVPGEEHLLEVRLARPGMASAGFQLSARFAEGELAGRQAGKLTVLPEVAHPAAAQPGAAPRVQVIAAHDVLYAAHTAAGAAPVRGGEARWRVRWRAPSKAAGPVVFHLAANAGNDDDSEFGDFVYLASAVSRPGPS
jgi:hypothetical protein